MPAFAKVHPVRHKAQEMFDLVADIERYPEFVPLCEALAIRSRREKGGRAILIADMSVGYKAIRETFTSQVLLNPAELEIHAQYLDGPFRYLDNRWSFAETGPGSCDVHFSIDYEFKSRVLAALMGVMFERAFAKFTRAFEERADAVYGRQDAPPAV